MGGEALVFGYREDLITFSETRVLLEGIGEDSRLHLSIIKELLDGP